ncbi:MAG: CRISPR-associated helicase Cas3', partial [Bacteroidales bacterium]|nr:CRISPR-associated helicase Cas3' [Bacteroidales bacterium]
MKLYKSFRELSETCSNLISDNLNNHYLAHISDTKPNETLEEHTLQVKKYALNLIDAHGLNFTVDNILFSITQTNPNHIELVNLLKEIFLTSIIYHDLGKINPNFQSLRMENPKFSENKSIHKLKHYHSLPGAIILQNYYFNQIMNSTEIGNDENKILLYYLTIIFTNTIIKHHSGRIDVKSEYDLNFIKEIMPFLKEYNIDIQKDISLHFYDDYQTLKDNLNEFFPDISHFAIYTLLKLNYSLLTAADYYATSEYMNDLSIDDFGVLNNESKNKIIHSFLNNPAKPYNKAIIERSKEFEDIPFEKLQSRNNNNLNTLRQKMAAEALSNIRRYKGENCFYLEAPTGSGKTNTSIALAIELLKQDERLNKIFYVFPFTTLVTQTYNAIKETIDIDDNEIIQLQSKTGVHSANGKEGNYGKDYKNYIDYLFANYPITVLTHIRFFEVLKGNDKESNYLLHRLANSIVIIDEVQAYTPHHWDKMIYFVDEISSHLNIKFLLMSATLPKLDELNQDTEGFFINLVPNKEDFFLNPNFKDRVKFEFLDWKQPKNEEEKETFLNDLSYLVLEKSEGYASKNGNKVRTVVEFVSKRTASNFLSKYMDIPEFDEYRKVLISGEILDSRRKEILDEIKAEEHDKIIVITTQVIEAGVDIDMDLGFKDKSLIDSEEQLAGRINREATKDGSMLYLFNYDLTKNTYGQDYRYKIQTTDEWIEKNYLNILQKKQFDALYSRVNKRLLAE